LIRLSYSCGYRRSPKPLRRAQFGALVDCSKRENCVKLKVLALAIPLTLSAASHFFERI
jgi:hypothetical protein